MVLRSFLSREFFYDLLDAVGEERFLLARLEALQRRDGPGGQPQEGPLDHEDPLVAAGGDVVAAEQLAGSLLELQLGELRPGLAIFFLPEFLAIRIRRRCSLATLLLLEPPALDGQEVIVVADPRAAIAEPILDCPRGDAECPGDLELCPDNAGRRASVGRRLGLLGGLFEFLDLFQLCP